MSMREDWIDGMTVVDLAKKYGKSMGEVRDELRGVSGMGNKAGEVKELLNWGYAEKEIGQRVGLSVPALRRLIKKEFSGEKFPDLGNGSVRPVKGLNSDLVSDVGKSPGEVLEGQIGSDLGPEEGDLGVSVLAGGPGAGPGAGGPEEILAEDVVSGPEDVGGTSDVPAEDTTDECILDEGVLTGDISSWRFSEHGGDIEDAPESGGTFESGDGVWRDGTKKHRAGKGKALTIRRGTCSNPFFESDAARTTYLNRKYGKGNWEILDRSEILMALELGEEMKGEMF